MPDFKVLRTNHTSFTVSDLDRSIAFFRDALGFEVTSKAPRDPRAIERIVGVAGTDIMVAYVRGPDHSLEPIQYLAPDDRGHVRPRPCDTGFAHIAFDVGVVYRVDKGPNTGARVCYLRDGDGITIEFIEKQAG